MKITENDIQKAIVAYLRAVLPSCKVFAIPNRAPRSKTGRALNATPGLMAGVPDLAIVAPAGRIHFLECKAPKGVLSGEQKAFRDWCIVTATPCAVVRSIDEVRVCLKAWNLETKEAA